MKRVLILLAVATIMAQSAGCCCRGTRCCPWRSWFYQGDYCGPTAAAPCCPTPVAAAPCCPAPGPQYQYAAPQPAPMMAYPANAAPNYGMTYAMEPNCASPKVVYDAGWMMQESSCGCSSMGGGYSGMDMGAEQGIILQSPDDMVYPGPAE